MCDKIIKYEKFEYLQIHEEQIKIADLKQGFAKTINMSPDMICNCSGGLFYGKAVAEVKKETLMMKGATDDFLNLVYYVKKITLYSVTREEETFCA